MVPVHYSPLRKFNDMFGDNVTRAASVQPVPQRLAELLKQLEQRIDERENDPGKV
jgi:hypothetical protein